MKMEILMKEQYQKIYKRLVEAYYSNSFETTLENILEQEFDDKSEGKNILAVICGADVNEETFDNETEFIQSLVHAITSKRVRDKIVQKIKKCEYTCEETDGKSKCQGICPFDAILSDPLTSDKWIDETLCKNCGKCITVCDRGNYLDTVQSFPVFSLLQENKNVVAIVAPAIAGQFGEDVTLDQLREAFIKVGFSDMVEVAMAADVLSLKEALEYKEHVDHVGDFMITSCCCPIWIALLKKVYHKLIPNVSPSVSPMIAMGRILKKLNPEVKVVFIGPCVAKKAEAKDNDLLGAVDYVLTFDELKLIFEVFHIAPHEFKGVPSLDYASTGGRLYARAGGVSQAVYDIIDQICPEKRELFSAMHVDGVPSCKALLSDLESGKVDASFIEGMGCVGGCVGGPKRLIDKEEGKKIVDKVAYESAIKIPVHSDVLNEILIRLDIPDYVSLVKDSSMFERNL